MDDDFLHSLRQEPSPAFACMLKQRLSRQEHGRHRSQQFALLAALGILVVMGSFPPHAPTPQIVPPAMGSLHAHDAVLWQVARTPLECVACEQTVMRAVTVSHHNSGFR